MTKEQAINLLVSLVKSSKLTEDERNICYEALKFLNGLQAETKDQTPVPQTEAPKQ